MSKVNTNISIDSNLKQEAVALFQSFGLDLSTAITLFLSQSVKEQRIPFEIKNIAPNLATLSAIDEVSIMDLNINNKTYKNIDELMEDLSKCSIL